MAWVDRGRKEDKTREKQQEPPLDWFLSRLGNAQSWLSADRAVSGCTCYYLSLYFSYRRWSCFEGSQAVALWHYRSPGEGSFQNQRTEPRIIACWAGRKCSFRLMFEENERWVCVCVCLCKTAFSWAYSSDINVSHFSQRGWTTIHQTEKHLIYNSHAWLGIHYGWHPFMCVCVGVCLCVWGA